MVGNGRSEEDLLDHITAIRVRNNDLWMGILSIALQADPVNTKRLMRTISKNDALIASELQAISHAPDDAD